MQMVGTSTANYFYTLDHLGSIREVTNSSAAVQTRYDYDPYGRKTVTHVSSPSSVDADFGYTGHYYHAPSSLSLTLYRAYDPDTARWLSRDPIGERGGLNLYGYCRNKPVNRIDPLGLEDQCTDCKGKPKQGNAVAVKCCYAAKRAYNDDENPYPPDYTYMGVSAAKMFEHTSDLNWSNTVRGCLECMYKHGAGPFFAHAFCYGDATVRSPLDSPGGWGDAIGNAITIKLGSY